MNICDPYIFPLFSVFTFHLRLLILASSISIRRQFSLFEFLVPDKAQESQATTSTFSHLPSNTHCLPETLHNLCLFSFLLDISPGYYRLPKRMKLIRTPPGMGSLRTADAFRVVASPSENFSEGGGDREKRRPEMRLLFAG